MSATPDLASGSLIREPGGAPPEVKEPSPPLAATAPGRNSFVPLAMPEIAPPASRSEEPQLASQPTFDFPAESPLAAGEPALTESMKLPASAQPQSGPYQTASTPANGPAFAPIALPAEAFVPQTPPPSAAPTSPPTNSPAMQAVAEQATQISDRALALARRGLFYSARAELIKALQLLAQALDAQDGTGVHASALAAGLTALEEAGDFAKLPARADETVHLADIASGHRTPVLKGNNEATTSPVVAQQQYLALAQSQLVIAAGGMPAASQTLYRLGRLHTGLSATGSDPLALHAPRAMVFHQAALATDGANFLAANELGVLLARFGQLPDARRLLLHSVTTCPHVEGWHNLAVVHRRLGESDLAKRAEHERDLVAKKADGATGAKSTGDIRWVDAKTFAAGPAADVPWREKSDQGLAAAPGGQRR
jgi:tetratricopeptide (TPR) repeat protein